MLDDTLNIVYLLLFLVIGTLLYLIISPSNVLVEEKENKAFCGTTSSALKVSNSGNSEQGKKLFKSNCAQCHNRNMKDDLMGPALGGTFNNWNKDTFQYALYLSDSEVYVDTTSNQRLIDLKKEFGNQFSHNFELQNNEIQSIINFIDVFYNH